MTDGFRDKVLENEHSVQSPKAVQREKAWKVDVNDSSSNNTLSLKFFMLVTALDVNSSGLYNANYWHMHIFQIIQRWLHMHIAKWIVICPQKTLNSNTVINYYY